MTGEPRRPGTRVSVIVAVAAVIWSIAVAVLVWNYPTAWEWLGLASFVFCGVLAVCLRSRYVIPFALIGVLVAWLDLFPMATGRYAYLLEQRFENAIAGAIFGCVLAICWDGFLRELCWEGWKRRLSRGRRSRELVASLQKKARAVSEDIRLNEPGKQFVHSAPDAPQSSSGRED